MSLTEQLLKSKLRPWASLFALGLSACASSVAAPPVEPVSSAASQAVVNSDMDAQLMYRILTAEIAQREHAFDIAYALMLEAAKSRHEAELYQRAIQIASEARAGNSALSAARLWRQAMPESLDAIRQTLGLELALQRHDDAAKSIQTLFKATPVEDLAAVSSQLPAALQRVQPEAKRLALAEQSLGSFFNDPKRGAYAHTVLGTLALQSKNPTQALEHAQLALQSQANNAAAATLAVALLESGTPAAKPLVERYLNAPDAAPRVRFFFARQLLQDNQLAQAKAQLSVLTQQHPKHAEGWLLLGRLQFDQHQFDTAQASTQRALEHAGDEALTQRAWMQMAEIAQAQRRWDEANNWLLRITEPVDELQWRFRRAALAGAQGRIEEGLKLIQAWPAKDEAERLQRTWLEVRYLRDLNALDQAYARLAQARQDFPEDNDLLYTQAMVAERLGKHTDMESLLRLHMQREPRDHQALNALGYSLADRGERLDEAQTLIQAALSLAPGDPFVTDSLGWVLFRQGKLDQAVQVLSRAWESRSDAEIAAHLGEVLWAQGQAEQAKRVWAQGLALDPENATLRETLKRLRVAL